jgi:hypothetical protein
MTLSEILGYCRPTYSTYLQADLQYPTATGVYRKMKMWYWNGLKSGMWDNGGKIQNFKNYSKFQKKRENLKILFFSLLFLKNASVVGANALDTSGREWTYASPGRTCLSCGRIRARVYNIAVTLFIILKIFRVLRTLNTVCIFLMCCPQVQYYSKTKQFITS